MIKYSRFFDTFQKTIVVVYIFGFSFKIANWVLYLLFLDKGPIKNSIAMSIGFVVSCVFILILHIFVFKMEAMYYMIILDQNDQQVRIKKFQEISRFMCLYIVFYLIITAIMGNLDALKWYYILTEFEKADSNHLSLSIAYYFF